MKEKILMLVIGVLIGAIITSVCFIAFYKPNSNENQIPNGQMPNIENFMPGNRQNEQIPSDIMTPPDGEVPTNGQMPSDQNLNEQKGNGKAFEKRTQKKDISNTNTSVS